MMRFPSLHFDYFRIYMVLVQRDLLMIKQRYKSAIIDAVVQLMVYVIIFGSLFPLMGVPAAMVAPLYVGTQVMNMMFFAMTFGYRILFDIRYTRFIDYRLTLPLPKRWLFASYITYFIIESLIISFPLMTLGIILLGSSFTMIDPHLFLFIPLYLMALSFYGLLALGFSFYYDYDWFMENVWPRRLNPLISFTPYFYTWYAAAQFSPIIAAIMRLNPFTYAVEGMRATLIGGPYFISPYICMSALGIWMIIIILFVSYSINKRLDPV